MPTALRVRNIVGTRNRFCVLGAIQLERHISACKGDCSRSERRTVYRSGCSGCGCSESRSARVFPDSIAGVVYQPGAFSCVNDSNWSTEPTAQSRKAAQDAINGWDPSGGAIYYYNPAKLQQVDTHKTRYTDHRRTRICK